MREEYRLFEKRLKEVVSGIRKIIADETDRSNIIFSIVCSGRVNEGDFLIKFKLENDYDSDCDVKGGSIDAILAEYIRRNAWQKRNAPLCLESPTKPEINDEIPF